MKILLEQIAEKLDCPFLILTVYNYTDYRAVLILYGLTVFFPERRVV